MNGVPLAPLMPAKRAPMITAWRHVLTMTDTVGIVEHADLAVPRLEHGYCTDDVARLLIAIVREPAPGRELDELARTCLRFLVEAQGVTGRVRNRRDAKGRWHGRRGVEDCWGRSAWAFGSAARLAPEEWMRGSATSYFEHAAGQRSPHRRAMAFAALGAAELLAVQPRHSRALRLLADAVVTIGAVSADRDWPWPEDRLSYANAALPEALIAAGSLLDRPEVLADACARAESVTGDAAWRDGVELAIGWFTGNNDAGVSMSDPDTGGAFDGLTPNGPNLNQGAESTLALISTMQHRRGIGVESQPAV